MVAEQLWTRGIECFLPLHEVTSTWKDRRKKIHVPLFPGYLFVDVHIQAYRIKILEVPSVVRLVGINGCPLPVPREQVEFVKRLVFSTLPFQPYPHLIEGCMVEIIRGPLKGLRGTLVEKKNSCKLILLVDLIQKAVACEVDACDVEKIW